MLISTAQSRAIGRRILALEPKFEEVVTAYGPCPIGTTKPRRSAFDALASSILSQQLSTKAAATITGRVAQLSGGKLDPEGIARLSIPKLRSAGCSNTKARSILELAEAVVTKEISFRSLQSKSDQEIIATLTPLYGIGEWTVQMFLIFQLNRLDVWPVADLGVRRGWEKALRLRVEISPNELATSGERFSPHRSHLAWYCWRAHSLYS
jgi:DNA-3-methyladenine glycosylase II